MSQRRYEGACNWIADANVTFCDKGGAAAWVRSDFLQKKSEQAIYSLLRRGAGNRTWTYNLLITNQLLCQLSYTSIPCVKTDEYKNTTFLRLCQGFFQIFLKFFLWVNFQNVRTLKKRISAHRVCLCKALCFSAIKYLLFYIFSPIFIKINISDRQWIYLNCITWC